jgi:RNA polymerase sigma-70 factor (ECF subfamily)
MSFVDRHDSGNSPDMAVMRPDKASAESPGWETIEELFAALEAPLLSYGLRLTGEIGLAEDVVQEAFMKLHAQFNEVRAPRRWLYRTVHNLALNQRRQASKIISLNSSPSVENELSSSADTADSAPLPDEQIIRMEGIGQVRLSLETLDDRSRELIRLKARARDLASAMLVTSCITR